MFKFRKLLLPSKPPNPLNLLWPEINKSKGVNRGWCINDIQPDEGQGALWKGPDDQVIGGDPPGTSVSNSGPSTISDDQQVKIPEVTFSPLHALPCRKT